MSKDKHNYITNTKRVMFFFLFQGTLIVVTLKLVLCIFAPFTALMFTKIISEFYYKT